MNRHDTDPLTLGLGVVFVVIGVGFLLGEVTGNDVEARWVVPIALLGVGLAGLVTSLIEIARRRDRRSDEPMDRPTADDSAADGEPHRM